jgi:RNA polymerase sigma-70 factor (ECF subfamily)
VSPPDRDVTALLHAWGRGDHAALNDLLPLVYGELRRQAARYMRAQSVGHTLQTTALVHEAFLRLVHQDATAWRGRAHFFGVAGKAMRSSLVDHARAREAVKRGRSARRLTLSAADEVGASNDPVDVLSLDQALARLSELDPELADLVEMRFFAGLSVEETAQALGISPATVKRRWQVARAWVKRELAPG